MNQKVAESVQCILTDHQPLPPGPQRCSCAVMTKPMPSLTKGLELFPHTIHGVELQCYLSYTHPCFGHGEHPDEPEEAVLEMAYLYDIDVIALLCEDDKDAVTTAFLELDLDDCEPDYAPDCEPMYA